MKIIQVLVMVLLGLMVVSASAHGYSEMRDDGSIGSGSIWEGSFVGEDGELK